ncbi:MAG: hypothetical protein COC06_10280 [Bacteroidales bacterium]|nr:MAG: hypothetical protein COC06_10280 [Bacteroidales bacterium]
MSKQKLFSKYKHGIISTKVIQSEALSRYSKVVYGLLKSQIGGMAYITTSQKQVKEFLNVSIDSVKRAFKELKDAGLLTKSKKAVKSYELKKVVTTGGKGNQFGWIESAVMESDKMSLEDKLFYLYYTAICNENDESKQPRVTVLKHLSVGNDTYIGVIGALSEFGLFQVSKGFSIKDGNEYRYVTKEVKLVRLPFISKKVLSKVAPVIYHEFESLTPFNHDERLICYTEIDAVQNNKDVVQNKNMAIQNKKDAVQDTLLNKLNKLNNNKKKKDSITISQELKESFSKLWREYPIGSKSSSLKSFQELVPSEYYKLEILLDESKGTYYGEHIKGIVAERTEMLKAKESKKTRAIRNRNNILRQL